MDEFNKALNVLHQTLMLAAGVVFAFALSADPTRDLIAADRAIDLVRTIDVAAYREAVAQHYRAIRSFDTPFVHSAWSSDQLKQTYAPCLGGPQVKTSYALAILLVPDAKSASVAQLADYLIQGQAYWLDISPERVAATLKDAGLDCRVEIAAGLRAIRLGSADPAIAQPNDSLKEIRTISSMNMAKFDALRKPGQTAAEFNFAVMQKLAQTASLELEYRIGDTIMERAIVPGEQLASPAYDTIDDTFAKYLPKNAARKSATLVALHQELGLIGNKTIEGAQETLRSEIELKKRYPTIFGIEVRSTHAIWGVPVAVLSLMVFLLVHARAYRAALASLAEPVSIFPSTLLFRGRGAAVVRVITLLLLPVFANVLFILRLADGLTFLSVAAGLVCFAIGAIGLLLLREFALIRSRAEGLRLG